jgi:hypothetical protein
MRTLLLFVCLCSPILPHQAGGSKTNKTATPKSTDVTVDGVIAIVGANLSDDVIIAPSP